MSMAPSDEYDEADMEALAGGADAALNRLMQRHGDKLFHYLIRLTQSEAEAADLAQETFVRVYQNRKGFRLDRKFTTWLYVIATNLARSFLRARRRHGEVSLEAENPATGEDLRDTLPDASSSPSRS